MILVVEPDQGRRERLRAALAATGETGEAATLADLRHRSDGGSHRTEVVVLGPGVDLNAGLQTTAELAADGPGAPAVVLVVERLSEETLRRGMRAGARDMLQAPVDDGELLNTVERARALVRRARGSGPSGEARRGRVVTVFSTKGGCGKSVVASNLAVLLRQETEREVSLVDLDLQSGDLAIMLQLLPGWSIYDAALKHDRLDEEALRGYLTPHSSGISLLAAPTDPALAESVSPEAVHRILHLLSGMFPHVVVDGPAFFTDQVLAALDESDECVLVGSMDVPSIKNLKLAIETLDALGFARQHLRVVLNRADSKVGLRVQDVERSIGCRVDVAVPSSRDAPLSVNQGTPLALGRRRSGVTAALSELAAAVLEGPAAGSPPRRTFTARG